MRGLETQEAAGAETDDRGGRSGTAPKQLVAGDLRSFSITRAVIPDKPRQRRKSGIHRRPQNSTRDSGSPRSLSLGRSKIGPEGCVRNDGEQVIKPEVLTLLGAFWARPAGLRCARNEGDAPEAGAVAASGARKTQPGASERRAAYRLSLPFW